ncbi:hypothetical protein SAFG77S_09121 [Streptomyces afghaniensis]
MHQLQIRLIILVQIQILVFQTLVFQNQTLVFRILVFQSQVEFFVGHLYKCIDFA